MGLCPKCKSALKGELIVCPKCGAQLVAGEDAGGSDTLNVLEHGNLDSASQPAPTDLPAPQAEFPNTDGQATRAELVDEEAIDLDATVDSVEVLPSQPSGSDTLDVELGLTPDPNQIEATSRELVGEGQDFGTAQTSHLSAQDFPDSGPDIDATVDSDAVVAQGDDVGTVINAQDRSGSSKGTAVYSETELRDALEGRTSGTAGKLKRLWDVAAGSSDNPLHTLRGEEALASDSLFKRVAVRRLVQANAPSDEEADYIIVDKVGQGGMGIVYSARQTNVNRLVALKAIKSELQSSDDSRRKFFYEAQITADLDHPNIVPIYELGATEDGLLFYAMKLITGTEWKDSIKTNTREENLEILAKINDAMAFAHSKSIVHRDLKPANTMIGPYGEVYVTDWGMAIDTDKKMRFGPGGSPAYMAPEMALHQVDKIGTASDIYILGAMLFQIVTGQAPHPGKSVQDTLRAAARNTIVAHKSEDALLPIALKAMSTNVEDRYKSVEEFQEALREYRQHGESIALAKRSEELLNQAVLGKDYDLFSRAVFGYRDAVELWPENESAVAGQRCAQLEYGRCAVGKGDFDLAMQVLDRKQADQALVYQQAVKGKQAIVDREKRVKNLRRIVAAVVLSGILITSSLAAYAWTQKSAAELNLIAAKNATLLAEAETNKAKIARDDAVDAQTKEKKAREDEVKAKLDAQKNEAAAKAAEKLAEDNRVFAVMQRDAAIKAKDAEELAKMNAINQQELAVKARDEADLAKIAAQKAAGQIKLEEYKSALPLAKSQLDSFDVQAARKTLEESKELQADVFEKLQPKSNTWPWQRVNLLSNDDLPQQSLGSGATSADYAPAVNLGVVGTKQGQVHVLSYVDGKLEKLFSYPEEGQPLDGAIESVAISPKGDEVVFNVQQGNESSFRVWPISAKGGLSKPQPVQAAARFSLQGFAYSQDGSYMVAGINKGIWLWKRDAKWYERKADNNYDKIRGRLKSISLIDDKTALVAASFRAELEEEFNVFTIDLQDKNTSRKVNLPEEFKQTNQVTAVSYDTVNKQLIIGTTLGNLYTGSLQTFGSNPNSVPAPKLTSTQSQSGDGKLPALQVTGAKEILPLKHRTAVQHITMDASGQMLTTGAEPVIHVWRRDPEVSWAYDTFLTGTKANLAAAVFVGKGSVLGIDDVGQSIVWDIQRQKQRRQMHRLKEEGLSPELYASPVIGVFPTANGQVLTVNQKGMIDRWDISTGATVPFDKERYVYAGHTPGAEFVDVAVDADAGIVATAARINNVSPLYKQPGDGDWEFCIWDQAKGTMIRRWRAEAEKPEPGESAQLVKDKGIIEQRLSLVDNGRALILASDKVTRVFSLEGKELFLAKNFGTYFAVPNPQAANELMLVMRSGAMAILDLKKLNAWSSAPRELALTTVSDTPQQGVWAPDGKSFYLTFTSGAVASFVWNGTKLQLEWSSHKLEGQRDTIQLDKALSSEATRVKSHADIDMTVRASGNSRKLYIARRVRGSTGETDWTVLEFDKAGSVKLVEHDMLPRVRWLDESGKEPTASERLHGKLRVDSRQVSARSQIKNQIYITTNNASVFKLSANSNTFDSLGQSTLQSVTGTKDGELLIALFADGSLKRFELADFKKAWQPCGYAAIGCSRAMLSPDGSQLALLGSENDKPYVRVVKTDSGEEIMRADGATAVTWDPSSLANGAIAYADGKIETFVGHERKPIATQALVGDAKISSIHYLVESWSSSEVAPVKHFVIQTETTTSGQIQFVPVEGQPKTPADKRKFENLVSIGRGVKLSVSPTEAVLVSGDPAGTVKLWFASPTWDDQPKELFDLEGHRGALIELATFNQDGTTLISADSKNRVYGWLSRELTRKPAP